MSQIHKFEADVSEVLKLVVHSLYSHKEIFLRELISNASDALDKLRFRSLTEPDLLEGDSTLEIRIHADKEAGILRIEDTGIGMTEAELVRSLGTIAYSGSRAFLAELAKAKGEGAPSLIGQFGVGFYSAYLVADKVEVVSRAAGPGQSAFKWTSDAKDSFTVEPADRKARGTEITLHVRESERGVLEDWKIKDLVLRYSDYVAYAIHFKDAQINQAKALWQRPKAEITDEQYNEFYRHVSHDFEPPLARTHFRIEGKQELVGLIYVPKHPPFDLDSGKRRRGLRLFTKRVFVMDDCEELLPPWLRFLRGVVDSDDLPLNVSRETLQDSALLPVLRKHVVKKSLDLLDNIATEKTEDYLVFWKAFGTVVKEGLALGESEYKDRIAPLLRYESTASPTELTSLKGYVERMQEGQDSIYYLYGESRKALEGSPYLEALAKRGYEVLFLTDPVDQWAIDGLYEFQEKKLVSAARADVKLPPASEEATAEKERTENELKPLIERMTSVLEAQVREVKVSDRLVDSPACLALAPGATPAVLERLLKERGKGVPHVKRTFEINPHHPLIQSLSRLRGSIDKEKFDGWIDLLYQQALLLEGGALEDPGAFARRLGALLTEVTAQSLPPA
jgi:molecular chaperone HtpG